MLDSSRDQRCGRDSAGRRYGLAWVPDDAGLDGHFRWIREDLRTERLNAQPPSTATTPSRATIRDRAKRRVAEAGQDLFLHGGFEAGPGCCSKIMPGG